MVERLWAFGQAQKRFPDHILFYRDGVSESQYGMVHEEELPQIKRAVNKVAILWKLAERGLEYNPKITLLVVGKRHHTRFFPKRSMAEDRNVTAGDWKTDHNIPAGLIIDHTVVTPHHCSFYLQSHDSPQGTAKTGHYVVITDEFGYSLDALQKLVSYFRSGTNST